MKRTLIILGAMIAVLTLVAWLAPQALSSLAPTAAPAVPSDTSTAEEGDHGLMTPLPAGATSAVVEYVHDGDTLFLEDGRKVRLLGINTPEIGDAEECWGQHAASELRGLLPEGQTVWVLEDVEPLDQYGRSLLFVFLPDGTNVNVEMVRVGAAEIEQYSPNWLYTDELHAAEDAAYADRVGLWGQC